MHGPWTATTVAYRDGLNGTAADVACALNRIERAGGAPGPILHCPAFGYILCARTARWRCQDELQTTLLPPIGGRVHPDDFEPEPAGEAEEAAP